MLCVINPEYRPRKFPDEEINEQEQDAKEETSRTNAFYENDVMRSDRAGRYVGSEERLALYTRHMDALKNRDPRVRVLHGKIDR